MNQLLTNDYFIIGTTSVLIMLIAWLWMGKVIKFFYSKSLSRREDLIHWLDLMFVEIDRTKITILMLLLSVGLGLLIFLLLLPNVLAGGIFAILVTIGGWHLPPLMVKLLYERRCSLFVDQMVDGLTIMANGIKSGLTVTQAMERVVENLPNPISQEFSLALSEVRVGRSVEEALLALGERIPKPDVQMFVTSINILKETGGRMAETFTTIVLTIRERQKVNKKIEALTAQGLMQGIIVSLVPFALILVFLFVDPAYIMPMFNTTLGMILLMTILGLVLVGGLTIRKVIKVDV